MKAHIGQMYSRLRQEEGMSRVLRLEGSPGGCLLVIRGYLYAMALHSDRAGSAWRQRYSEFVGSSMLLLLLRLQGPLSLTLFGGGCELTWSDRHVDIGLKT